MLQQAVEDKASQHIEIYDHLGEVLMALNERGVCRRGVEDGFGARVRERPTTRVGRSIVEEKIQKAEGSEVRIRQRLLARRASEDISRDLRLHGSRDSAEVSLACASG